MEKNQISIKLNPLFYPLEVVYSASYALIDKAYFSFDGDPDKEIIVNVVPKENVESEQLRKDFNNELLNYLEYKMNYERNKDIRHVILQKALELGSSTIQNFSGNSEQFSSENIEDEDLFDDDDDLDFIDDDPLEIALPWEEKYSKSDSGEDSSLESGEVENAVKEEQVPVEDEVAVKKEEAEKGSTANYKEEEALEKENK